MSLNAQSTRPKPIGIPDQIESFLYSLVYIAVQYIPSTVSPGNIPYFIAAAFHESRTCPITGLQRPCPMKYFTISQGQFDVYPWTERLRYTKLQFLSGSEESGWTSHPIDFIMTYLMSWLKDHHDSCFEKNAKTEEQKQSRVHSHDDLLVLMEGALQELEWPLNDKRDLSWH